MRQLDEEAFFAAAKPHMVAAGYMTGDECGEKLEWLKRVVATAKEHVAFAAQIPECVAMYFSDEFEFENAEAAAVLQEESVPTVMNMLFEELPKLEVLDGPAVKAAFKAIQKATKLGGKAVFMPIRVALTGNQHGPELAEMVPLLGLERTEARIRASLAKAGITLQRRAWNDDQSLQYIDENKKEEFVPVHPGKANIYVCGVTPYNHPHIGNARPFVTWDVIRRFLEHEGYDVLHVQNFTDVDDKIINTANKEGVLWSDVCGRYIDAYFEVMDKLNVRRAHVYPRVSEHMEEIIETVKALIDRGYAYEMDGDCLLQR